MEKPSPLGEILGGEGLFLYLAELANEVEASCHVLRLGEHPHEDADAEISVALGRHVVGLVTSHTTDVVPVLIVVAPIQPHQRNRLRGERVDVASDGVGAFVLVKFERSGDDDAVIGVPVVVVVPLVEAGDATVLVLYVRMWVGVEGDKRRTDE